jgi:hypothetical protein
MHSIFNGKVLEHRMKPAFLLHMFVSRHQNAGQNHNIKIAKRFIENVAQFTYVGTTVTDQNLI